MEASVPRIAGEAAPAGARLWLQVFAPYAFGYFLSYLLRTVTAVLAPELINEFGISASGLGLLTGAYLVAFACMQLPIGVALDRFGARRVQVVLLVCAALGCALFAAGRNSAQLLAARAMIGAGVAGCLMSAYKTFAQSFGRDRQAPLNAAMMVAGSFGALTASAPFGLLLPLFGWRVSFAGFAAAALLAAWWVSRVPETAAAGSARGLAEELRGVRSVFSTSHFWRVAPLMAALNGGFTAVQGLWAVPWLTGAAGLGRAQASWVLLGMNLALMLGYFALASSVGKLLKRGCTLDRLIMAGALAFELVSLALIVDVRHSAWWWPLLGLSYAASNLLYAYHAGHYPAALAGRANTCVNLVLFLGGFAVQWGLGLVVDSATAHGLTTAEALALG